MKIIQSKAATPEYKENWERIFRKNKDEEPATETRSEEPDRIPNVDYLTVEELKILQSRISMLLQHRMLGDPMRGVTSPSS